MSSLADKVIQANEREKNFKQEKDESPQGYYTDDLGMWVEKDIRQHASMFARYVYVRCRMINPHLYYDNVEMVLYNRHKTITPTTRDIVDLANLADMITMSQAVWVYNKLKETVPRLDKSKIMIAPGFMWNIETARIEKMEKNYFTVGGGTDE